MAETPAEGLIHYITPKGEYIPFLDDTDYIAKGLEWKLFTALPI